MVTREAIQRENELRNYISENYSDPERGIQVYNEYRDDFIPSRFQRMRSAVYNSLNSGALESNLDSALTREDPSFKWASVEN